MDKFLNNFKTRRKSVSERVEAKILELETTLETLNAEKRLEGNVEDGTFNKEQFLKRIKAQNELNEILGSVVEGWWDLDEDTFKMMAPAKKLKCADFVSMAHAMHAAGFFKSVGEAKRNGWDKPCVPGKFKVGKNKHLEME